MVESPLKSILCVNRPTFASAQLDALSSLARVIFVEQLGRDQFKKDVRMLLDAGERFDGFLLFHRMELPKLYPLDKELLCNLVEEGGLQFITSGGAGYDQVEIDYLTSRGVSYANNPTSVGIRTADSTSSMILQVLRGSTQIEAYIRSAPEGRWREPGHIIKDARACTLGIIGLGNIGQFVAQQMQFMGMRVVYNKRSRLPPSEEHGAIYVSFVELLEQSDVISVLCPLTPATRHLISYPEFAKMKDGVLIVNTARGPIVDEKALVDSLASGKVLRAALDVFEREPIIHPDLLSNKSVTLAAHLAANNETLRLDIECEQIDNMWAYLKTGRGKTPVN